MWTRHGRRVRGHAGPGALQAVVRIRRAVEPLAAARQRFLPRAPTRTLSSARPVTAAQVPWLIDPSGEADSVLRTFIHLKHRLMPYLYAAALCAHRTGVPLMRALFVEFAADAAVWTLDAQYMLGGALLVAPVFTAAGDVQFYVPAGAWYGLIDGKVRNGPGYVVEEHGFESMPVLLRPSTAIVMGAEPLARAAVYDYADGVTVLVNPGAGIDAEVEVPDSTATGEVVAVLRVSGSTEKIKVEVVRGALKGAWKVKVVGGESVRETSADVDGKVAEV
jgi:alpha-D-xyloside xylohydrolase